MHNPIKLILTKHNHTPPVQQSQFLLKLYRLNNCRIVKWTGKNFKCHSCHLALDHLVYPLVTLICRMLRCSRDVTDFVVVATLRLIQYGYTDPVNSTISDGRGRNPIRYNNLTRVLLPRLACNLNGNTRSWNTNWKIINQQLIFYLVFLNIYIFLSIIFTNLLKHKRY